MAKFELKFAIWLQYDAALALGFRETELYHFVELGGVSVDAEVLARFIISLFHSAVWQTASLWKLAGWKTFLKRDFVIDFCAREKFTHMARIILSFACKNFLLS